MNYFELLDLEQRYDIDLKKLHQQYLQKQILYHPDRVASESGRSKNLNLSMELNNAYKILKDDYSRAEYLLKILGQAFDDNNLKNILNDQDLAEILEDHETIDRMINLDDIKNFKEKKLEHKKNIIEILTEAFKEPNLIKALEITLRLKYLTNLVKNIELKIKHANN